MSDTGLGTPFINVTFQEFFWGYQDDLPCVEQNKPAHCHDPDEDSPFASEPDDAWGDEGWGADDWGTRKKRSALV